MIVVAWITILVAIVSGLIVLIVKQPDVKRLAELTYLAAMIALMISLAGHVAKFNAL